MDEAGDEAGGRDLCWSSADGLALHARDYVAAAGAEGPTVICLHGLTRNARDFGTLAPWLAARGHRVIAADMRGRGFSAWDPAARYLLPVYADDVRRLMEAAALPSAVFVGTSMGGLIVMELAQQAPGLIAGAVVNDVGPVLGEAGLTRIAAYVGKPVTIGSWADATAYVRWQNERAFPHYGPADWEAMARRLFRARDGVIAPDYDPAIAHPFADASAPRNPWLQWRALTEAAPVLLLRGGRSDLLERPCAEAMAVDRRVTLVEVPGVGHAPMLDEPAARAAIGDYLRRLA